MTFHYLSVAIRGIIFDDLKIEFKNRCGFPLEKVSEHPIGTLGNSSIVRYLQTYILVISVEKSIIFRSKCAVDTEIAFSFLLIFILAETLI